MITRSGDKSSEALTGSAARTMWWTLHCWKHALRHSQKSPRIKLLMAPFIVLFSSNDCGCCQNSQGTVGHAMQNVWLTREAVFSAPEAVLNQLRYGPVRPFKMRSGEIISGAGQGWILSFFFIYLTGMSFCFSGIFRSLNLHQGPLSSIIHFNGIALQSVVICDFNKR